MNEEIKYEYVTANVALGLEATQGNDKVYIPDGKVVAIGAIVAGNTENRIINLSILDNNNEVVRACDVRFSEKTNGGTFKDSMRPVDFFGGRNYEVRLVALSVSSLESVAVQVLFMIEKPQTH